MRNKLILGLTGLSGIDAGKVDKKPKFDILRSTKGCGDPAQWYRLKDCVLILLLATKLPIVGSATRTIASIEVLKFDSQYLLYTVIQSDAKGPFLLSFF